ncbi:UNVERIFIED_CONTAM: hypothetical protein GTU68_031968 [Idotea baltica]|nr:hypothetical protein [Idotea baltica]
MGNPSTKKTKKEPKQFISWFEIPVLDLSRAVSFFNHVYDIQLEITGQSDYSMALFPVKTGVGGALVKGQGCIPSETGSLIYLNATDDMTLMLQRIEEAGGRIIMEKTLISEDAGYFSLFIDTEGNKLALHSNQ